MKPYKLSLLILILFTSLSASTFESVYTISNFKIFYTLYGDNKLPTYNQVDDNHNNIPDYIELIGKQLEESRRLFHSMNYINPLESKRYKSKAYFITVSIVTMKNKGTTYDGINKAKKNNLERSKPSLAMKISNTLSPNSLTPLHEYFHLIQNGYTMFKNRWYTEGTARWSESLLKSGVGKHKRLPQSNYELNTILSQTYKTSYMWNRLTHLVDKNSCQSVALGNHRICGTEFMKSFLENLMRYDKLVSREMRYCRYNWKEKDQKSSKNNKYILMALIDTIKMDKSNNKEVKKFLILLDKYVNP